RDDKCSSAQRVLRRPCQTVFVAPVTHGNFTCLARFSAPGETVCVQPQHRASQICALIPQSMVESLRVSCASFARRLHDWYLRLFKLAANTNESCEFKITSLRNLGCRSVF